MKYIRIIRESVLLQAALYYLACIVACAALVLTLNLWFLMIVIWSVGIPLVAIIIVRLIILLLYEL
jgi:hypothetical protein